METGKTADHQLVHMRFDQSLLHKVDDFRFKYRFASRTETIRWLVGWALKQKPKPDQP